MREVCLEVGGNIEDIVHIFESKKKSKIVKRYQEGFQDLKRFYKLVQDLNPILVHIYLYKCM